MIRKRNQRAMPTRWPVAGAWLVIRPWPKADPIKGTVIAAGPHGVLLAGTDEGIPWGDIAAYDEYLSGDEYRDIGVEATETLMADWSHLDLVR